MKPIKLTENLEFDLIYADGIRKRVKEGILFEVVGEKMFLHNGSDRKEVLFAVIECVVETAREMGWDRELFCYLGRD